MALHFFHEEQEIRQADPATNYHQQQELSDEQLAEVAGGFIIAGQKGQLDWMRRLWYQHTHPGTMIPLTQSL